MTTPRPSPPEKRGLRGLQCRRATLGVLTSAAVGRTTPGGPSGDPRGLGQRPRARGPRGRVYRAGLAGRGLHTAARTLLRVAASEVQEGGAGPNWICSFRGPGRPLLRSPRGLLPRLTLKPRDPWPPTGSSREGSLLGFSAGGCSELSSSFSQKAKPALFSFVI